MNRFVLTQSIDEENKLKVIGEGVKFSNGKCCLSLLHQNPFVSVFDNIDQLSNIYVNDSIKVYFLKDADNKNISVEEPKKD